MRCRHGLKEGQCSLCAGMKSRVTCEETGTPVWFVNEHTNYIRQLAARIEGERAREGNSDYIYNQSPR